MVRGPSLVALLSLALLAFGAAGAQAAPVNDDFANATPITAGETINSDNIGATAQPQDPEFFGACEEITESAQCASTVWYSFEAPSTGNYTVETCDMGTTIENHIGIYTGSFGSLSVVSQAQGGCSGKGIGTSAILPATAGVTYRIGLGGREARQGSFYLKVYAGPSVAPPTPDTGLDRYASFASAKLTESESSGALGASRSSATFPLIGSTAAVIFECSLDGAAFAPCTTPVSYDELAPGTSHVFSARAVEGGVPDPTPLVDRFTIDKTPPDTTIFSGPPSESHSQKAEFSFAPSPDLDGANSFMCGFDSQPTVLGCNQTDGYEELCAGEHSFRAAAYDPASNLDPTPAADHFVSTTGPACAAPTLTPLSIGFENATQAEVAGHFEDGGAGGVLRLEYGPTTAYGTVLEEPVQPSASQGFVELMMRGLAPSSTYHYKVTLQTPFGTVSSADGTATTEALPHPLAGIQNGTPLTDEHAATIPFEVDPNGVPAVVKLELDTEALSGRVEHPRFEGVPKLEGSGPQERSFQVVDLEPAVTYRYRAVAEQLEPPYNEIRGPEGTFTTPKGASISTSFKPHFVLSKRLVSVGKLQRGVRGLIVRLHGLPAASRVAVRLTLGHRQAAAHEKASSGGRARLVLRLSRRLAAAIAKTAKHKLPLLVTAAPPNDTPSSVTVSVGLKPAPKKKHKKR